MSVYKATKLYLIALTWSHKEKTAVYYIQICLVGFNELKTHFEVDKNSLFTCNFGFTYPVFKLFGVIIYMFSNKTSSSWDGYTVVNGSIQVIDSEKR